jgi:hypothetical protein
MSNGQPGAIITRRVLVTAERRAGDELPVVAPS